MTDDYIEHMKMVQSVVSRLAGNSFRYKGWSLTLISALLAFAAKDLQPGYALVGLVPAIAFWWLDAYYLLQERLFRRRFDEVRNAGLAPGAPPTDFSMKACPPPVGDPDFSKFTLIGVAFSKTVAWLHLPLIAAVIIIAAGMWAFAGK